MNSANSAKALNKYGYFAGRHRNRGEKSYLYFPQYTWSNNVYVSVFSCTAMLVSFVGRWSLRMEPRWLELTSASSTIRRLATQLPGRMEGKSWPFLSQHGLKHPHKKQQMQCIDIALKWYSCEKCDLAELQWLKAQSPPQALPLLICFVLLPGPILEFSAQFPEKSNKARLVRSQVLIRLEQRGGSVTHASSERSADGYYLMMEESNNEVILV